MEKQHLKKFETQSDYDAQKDEVMGMPHVVLIEDTKEVIFASENNTPSDPSNGHDYVDLGLPSGTLWATRNVGAESEEDYGLYFQWGDTEGWTAEQIQNGEKKFNDNFYKWIDVNGYILTKYNEIDGKTVLDLEDDSAHVHMGGDWHMPTKEQLEELTANTTSTWTTQNGVNGRLLTSNTNGNSMFVPAASRVIIGGISNVGSCGYVLSSSLLDYYLSNAWTLDFKSSNVRMYDYTRVCGYSVRGVLG